MIATRFVIAALAVLCATAATAQTPSEMLEKAIFSHESVGDLDGAISMYERLLSTPGVPREIAARAQTQLSAGRRQRDQATQAAAVAAHQSGLPRGVHETTAQAQPAAAGAAQAQATGGCCGAFSDNYDAGRAVTVNGRVVQVEWVNPLSMVIMDGDDGKVWGLVVDSPNTMFRAGWNRTTLKIGDQLLVYGYLAKGRGECPAQLPNACATLQNGALHVSASTISRDGKTIFDRLAVEQDMQRRQEEERTKAAAGR